GKRSPPEVGVVVLPLEADALWMELRDQFELVDLRRRMVDRGRRIQRYRYELSEFVSIARAISSERDVVKLLGLILEKARFVTGADGGTVYLVESEADPLGQQAATPWPEGRGHRRT